MNKKRMLLFQFIYNVLLVIFFNAAYPYFLIKMLFVKKYRHGLPRRLGFFSKSAITAFEKGDIIWFHAVSVGEVQTTLPLIEKTQSDYPDKNFILSTTTYTGQQIAKKWAQDKQWVEVIYFPLDFFHVFHGLFSKYSIKLIVVMETEIWPNFFMEAYWHGIPLMIANCRISDKSYSGYKKLKPFFSDVAKSVKYFCVQEESTANKLFNLGINKERIHFTGNIKYDASMTFTLNKEIGSDLKNKLMWTDDSPILVIGSTHKGEEKIVCGLFNAIKDNIAGLKMIIAPRHPERIKEVEKILSENGISYIKKTDADKSPNSISGKDVVLLDTMGELRHIYAIATVVFVGKSLVQGGGQNILEPASLGKPVVFGQYMDNFKDVADKIVTANAGIMVHNETELNKVILKLFSDKQYRELIGLNALNEIKSWCGATDKTLGLIKKVLIK